MKQIVLELPQPVEVISIGQALNTLNGDGHNFVVYKTRPHGHGDGLSNELAIMQRDNDGCYGFKYVCQHTPRQTGSLKYLRNTMSNSLCAVLDAGREVYLFTNIVEFTQFIADFYSDKENKACR